MKLEKEDFTPEIAFQTIQQVVNEAKLKFEENGFIYMFWGALVSVAASTQFVLLKMEQYQINWYPYFLMPIGGVISYFYYAKKDKTKSNHISRIILTSWSAISANLMILGFFFAPLIGAYLVPILLIIIGIGIILSASSINSRMLLVSGMLINLTGFIGFGIEWIYHSLLLGVVALLAIFVPGIILQLRYKRRSVQRLKSNTTRTA